MNGHKKISQQLYRSLEEFNPAEQQRLQVVQASCPDCGQVSALRGVLWGHDGGVFTCASCGEFVVRGIDLPVRSIRPEDRQPLTIIISAALSALAGLALVVIWIIAVRRVGRDLSVDFVLLWGILYIIQTVGLRFNHKWAYYLTLITFIPFLPPIGWFLVFGYLQQNDVRRHFGLKEKKKGVLES